MAQPQQQPSTLGEKSLTLVKPLDLVVGLQETKRDGTLSDNMGAPWAKPGVRTTGAMAGWSPQQTQQLQGKGEKAWKESGRCRAAVDGPFSEPSSNKKLTPFSGGQRNMNSDWVLELYL